MKRKNHKEYSDEFFKAYMAVPVRKKLKNLEQFSGFLDRLMPKKNKLIWEQLKKEGL